MLCICVDMPEPSCGVNGVDNQNTGYCDCSPGLTGPSCDDGTTEN